jgi:hypothetical protein
MLTGAVRKGLGLLPSEARALCTAFALSLLQAAEGLHVLVAQVLRQNKLVVVGGFAGDVRIAVDWLRNRLSPTVLQASPIDLWTPAEPDNRPYRWRRSNLTLLSTSPVAFQVCTAPRPPQGFLGSPLE